MEDVMTDDFAEFTLTRRAVLGGAAGIAAGLAALHPLAALAAAMRQMGTRPIPSTGERLPMVGVGTARVFDYEMTPEVKARLGGVLKTMVEAGGSMIDSANGYGRAEAVAGRLVADLGLRPKVFIATKVGANDREDGIAQMQRSLKLFHTDKIELMYVHNLRDWRTQLKTMRAWKERGIFKYIGVTHYSTGRADVFAEIMRNEKIDFIQFPYSIERREAEKRIMPMAQERKVAVVTHRNFGLGRLFRKVRGETLPEWAADYDIESWAQYFLKFALSHPASTAVIPGTGKIAHMVDNVKAGMGRLPDLKGRERMAQYVAGL
jgi:aryl-alcohol dehydrogenase-like predicted oxidoreductase